MFAAASKNKSDDVQYLRYNVNGIELDSPAFEKLRQEIDLRVLKVALPDLNNKRVKLHTGIFPTKSGKYQRLIIRESRVPEINPRTFRVKRLTSEAYYEVCTHPVLYDRVRKQLGRKS